MFGFFRKKPKVLTPGLQLKELKKLGIVPRPGVEEREFLKFREEVYIEKPYLLVLIALGGVDSKLQPVSDRIWHLHRDSVQNTGDYAAIAGRFRDLARGTLPLSNITDSLDGHVGQASLSFQLHEQSYQWQFPWNGSSLDAGILTMLPRLQLSIDVNRRFAFYKLGGRDTLIGCFTDQERDELEQLTELSFLWMTGEDRIEL